MTAINSVPCPRCHSPVGEPCRRTRLERLFGKRGAVLHDERVDVFGGFVTGG